MANSDFHALTGVFHSFKVREAKSKQGEKLEFVEFFVEKESSYGEHTYTDVLKFGTSAKVKDEIKGIKPGTKVEVSFILKGRFFKSKYDTEGHVNELKCTSVKILEAAPATAEGDPFGAEPDSSDLPF